MKEKHQCRHCGEWNYPSEQASKTKESIISRLIDESGKGKGELITIQRVSPLTPILDDIDAVMIH